MREFLIATPTSHFTISALNIWQALAALGLDAGRGVWFQEIK